MSNKSTLVITNKSGKGRGTHYHVAYVNADGNGYTSHDNKHTHNIKEFKVDKTDEHTHSLSPIPERDIFGDDNQDERELAIQTVSLWEYSNEFDVENNKKAKTAEKFYRGEQWNPGTKADLESKKRAVLTINEIESKIDYLSGYERQTRTDFRYFPVEGGDQATADILTVLAKNITEQNDFKYQRTEVFDDVLIIGRGLYNMYVDREHNMEGDIIIEQFPWDGCTFGPHKKKTADDCDYLTKHKWFSIAELKAMYPEDADKINEMLTEMSSETEEPDGNVHNVNPGTQYSNSDNKFKGSWKLDLLDISNKRIKVLEQWRKIYRNVNIVVNVEDEFYYRADGLGKSDIAKVKTIPGLHVIPRKVFKIRVITVAGTVVLEDQNPAELSKDDFHIIPVYAKKRGSYWWGRISAAIGMQNEINKRHSQVVDILNKVAAYGWFIDDQTFSNPQELEKFKRDSSSPGFVSKVSDVSSVPVQVEGVKFPSEIVQMMLLDQNKISSLMGLDPTLFDKSRDTKQPMSGIALVEQRRQGLVGNEFLYDNMSLGDRRIGRMIVAMIQKTYSVKRMMRILDYQATREQFEIGGSPYIPEMPEELSQLPPDQMEIEMQKLIEQRREQLKKLLTNTDLTKYDVVIGESVHSPTTRHANFMIWSELAKAGLPVPPIMLIELSDLPEKEKAKKYIIQEGQKKDEFEKLKYEVEIMKTMIAKGEGSVTPPSGGTQ